ncbi:MarR family winged helix-turn-helix transcriptional regulator [Alloalcanivorax sp. C16-2]|uniref:MarR family winged helix-turn-helix transcriptional regulator n=1 Tax=Alloalcanivorax TaxID=3020832 RepID=UPI0019313F6D|nr:MarR family transcriptional regulator [Alloalcanivorax marinus]MBL7251444.1 MarR family transcriptional regulator [Alloalcanivorax marinus]
MVIHNKSRLPGVALTPLDPLDAALEALHFGFRGLTVEADRYLATLGLSRVHHRILYVIARAESITVGELAALLGISKQALHRPLTFLTENDYVTMRRDADNHRFKQLALTPAGRQVEQAASQHERDAVAAAFARVPAKSRDDWYRIMGSLASKLE